MASVLRRHGDIGIVQKLGAAGCAVLAGRQSRIISGFPVPVADTTGDCFAAGFLGALAVTAPGAVRGMDAISDWSLLKERTERAL